METVLSETDKAQFLEAGYLKIPQLIPAPMLQSLRHLFNNIIHQYASSRDMVYQEKAGKVLVSNIDNICNQGVHECLALLGAPYITSIAKDIVGEDCFPVQDFAVIKMQGDDLPVLWHQDMLHPQRSIFLTMGIYLDDAHENDGALKVVPKSHVSGNDICTSAKEPTIDVAMQAGDVLLHDMMLAHSSSIMKEHTIRRVIYFEFLNPTAVRADQLYPEEVILQRTQLFEWAQQFYVLKYGTMAQENIAAQDEIINAVQQLYLHPVKGKPSAYCFEF
ncbi:MAG: phytanoyl-CoA dioxygenase family protein [Ferruginibacter sp.]